MRSKGKMPFFLSLSSPSFHQWSSESPMTANPSPLHGPFLNVALDSQESQTQSRKSEHCLFFFLKRYLYIHVQSNIIHNSQEVKATQIFINR